MSKQEFLTRLRKGLSGLPQDDIEERLAFYSEMIDDRMEEGLSEEDAVCAIGNIDELISQIIADIPITKLVKEKITPRKKLQAWEILLLVLGSPIWLSLGIAAFAVGISVYAVLWSLIISLWTVFASIVACAAGGVLSCVALTMGGNGAIGVAMLAAGIVCTGLSIFMFYGCKAATNGTVILTKKIAIGIKNCFIKKEVA